ncbi:WSC domain-containing protein [Hippea alviniae]|uniref:WSC domain-containing protein n=1 Tax=Hippea alviniae TaxID=1279027 RepID=UPI0003B3F39F|nr:WSC domain-containing protein [Hippea alviniae]
MSKKSVILTILLIFVLSAFSYAKVTGIRIDNFKAKPSNSKILIEVKFTAYGLNTPIPEQDSVEAWLEVKESSHPIYPVFWEYYNLAKGCLAKGKWCINKQDKDGVGIKKISLGSLVIRPPTVWLRYGGLGQWEKKAPDSISGEIKKIISAEYQGKEARVHLALKHITGGPNAAWPSIVYYHTAKIIHLPFVGTVANNRPKVSVAAQNSEGTPTNSKKQAKQVLSISYLGCFKDGSARDLSGFSVQDSKMSIGKCKDICRKHGFLYAGVQYASWCFCGNYYGKYGKSNNCNMKCSGDKSQICGGSWANSVYLTGLINPKSEIVFESDIDRMGMDYKNFELNSANPILCKNACYRESKCVAWTYVKPHVQSNSAKCWLKYAVPTPSFNKNCVSGVKDIVKLMPEKFKIRESWGSIFKVYRCNPTMIPNSNQYFGWKNRAIKIGDANPPSFASGVLYLHPITIVDPAVLEGDIKITRPDEKMIVRVAGNKNGDFLLIVNVNRVNIFRKIIDGRKWHLVSVPLSKFYGKNAHIRIIGYANNWYFEYIFIDYVKFE